MKSTLIAAALMAAVAGAHAQNVATVNGKPVPLTRVETMIQQITKNGQPRSPEMEKQVRDEVVHREILMQEAQRRGIRPVWVRWGSFMPATTPEVLVPRGIEVIEVPLLQRSIIVRSPRHRRQQGLPEPDGTGPPSHPDP